MKPAPVVWPKSDLPGVPFWTTDGVASLLDVLAVLEDKLAAHGLAHAFLLTTNFVSRSAFHATFGDRFTGDRTAVTAEQYLATESNLFTFPHILARDRVDCVHVTLVQRFRRPSRRRDGWHDSHLWPCVGVNTVASPEGPDLSRMLGLYRDLFAHHDLPCLVVEREADEYGHGYTLFSPLASGEYTGLAMLYQLGPLFTAQWPGQYRYLNTGFTGKLLLYLAELRAPDPGVVRHFDFEDNAVMPLCIECAKSLGMVVVGRVIDRASEPCCRCDRTAPLQLIAKRNNVY